VFASGAAAARGALDGVGRAADRAGLQLHPDKTRIHTDRDEARWTLLRQRSSDGASRRMA
jgi:hypothetical protein